mmetsp:Transcript_2143/g.5036  ORF Transcript_2143/g.5036 Transcript_2143/m.5036 type:complete len:446 (+) Transcript_2143:202-1539(+)
MRVESRHLSTGVVANSDIVEAAIVGVVAVLGVHVVQRRVQRTERALASVKTSIVHQAHKTGEGRSGSTGTVDSTPVTRHHNSVLMTESADIGIATTGSVPVGARRAEAITGEPRLDGGILIGGTRGIVAESTTAGDESTGLGGAHNLLTGTSTGAGLAEGRHILAERAHTHQHGGAEADQVGRRARVGRVHRRVRVVAHHVPLGGGAGILAQTHHGDTGKTHLLQLDVGARHVLLRSVGQRAYGSLSGDDALLRLGPAVAHREDPGDVLALAQALLNQVGQINNPAVDVPVGGIHTHAHGDDVLSIQSGFTVQTVGRRERLKITDDVTDVLKWGVGTLFKGAQIFERNTRRRTKLDDSLRAVLVGGTQRLRNLVGLTQSLRNHKVTGSRIDITDHGGLLHRERIQTAEKLNDIGEMGRSLRGLLSRVTHNSATLDVHPVVELGLQ